VGKLIIDPQKLAEIRAAVAALDAKPAPAPELTKEAVAVEPVPERVRQFWHAEERIIPPWELETVQEREQREFFQGQGTWTG
jgi:hypothetical protein